MTCSLYSLRYQYSTLLCTTNGLTIADHTDEINAQKKTAPTYSWDISVAEGLVLSALILGLKNTTNSCSSKTTIHLLGLQVWWAKGLHSSPKFICLNSNPQRELRGEGAFGKWLGYEGGVLVNKISDLEWEPQSILFSSLPREDSMKMQPSATRKRPLTRPRVQT